MRVADYIIEKIFGAGAEHIFMVTGRGILYLSDAVARNKNIKCTSVHHEQSAAYAACAYAQYSNKIGACIVSTGCAATNALTGVLCAWQDNIPCVFISGQNFLNETVRHSKDTVRTYGQQENDIIKIVEPITKYSIMLDDPKQVVYEIEKALHIAQCGRKGPVWIDIPLDIQDARIEPEELSHFIPDISDDNNVFEKDIEYIVNALNSAKRPVILVGGGVRNVGAEKIFTEFALKTQIPVVYTNAATDLYDSNYHNSIGVVSSIGGTRAGNFTIQNADLVVSFGSRLSPMTTGGEYTKFLREGKLIVVDIDDKEHKKDTVKIDCLITGNIFEIINSLLKKSLKPVDGWWTEKCAHWKEVFKNQDLIDSNHEKIDLYYLAECLSDVLPDNSVLCTDAGLEEVILPNNIKFKNQQRCIHSVSQGAMGYALPASIGLAYVASGDVVTVVGDGSIMMNLQELVTISYNNLPVKIIVINNNGYSVIRKRQKDIFRTRTIGNDKGDGVGFPSFEKVALCFGIAYKRISEFASLKSGLTEVMCYKGPIICEIDSDENQKYIHSSFARNKDRKTVKRPLEDQAPYIDRKLFCSEMVIEPIDQ